MGIHIHLVAQEQVHLELGKYRGVFYCIAENLTPEKFDALKDFFAKH